MPLDPSTASRLKDALGTVVVIPVTPMRPDGSPEWGTYSVLIRRVVDAGITVITPNGNTGEFYALTEAEARQATEAAVKAAHGEVARGARAHVLVGVGHDTASAAAAARHAREAGAEMIMIHQPVHPYQAAEGWVDYHQAIADAVPDLGVVLYVRDERVTGAQIADLGERCPNVIGIKYGVKDATQFAAVARDAGLDRFTWLAGLAEPYAPGYWAYGARGFTSGLANVNPATVAVPAGGAARRRPRRGDGCMGGHPAVRGSARGGRGRGQRERREGSAGAARPVRPGCAAAEPGLASFRTGGGGSHPAVLGPVRGQ